MTDKNPFEAMMAMGQDWAKQLNPGMEAFSTKGFEDMFPTMSKEMMETFFGKGMNPEGLDVKTKLLLTVTGALAETQIRLTVRHLVEAGATKQEIAETIAQAAMFGGVPAMTKAMEFATDVMKKDAGQ